MLRGEETVERARTKTAGSKGEDVQLIYPDHKLVIWSELQIWSGVCPRGKNHFTVVAVAPCVDGSRRATRVVKKSAGNLEILTELDKYTASCHRRTVERLKHCTVCECSQLSIIAQVVMVAAD